MKYKLKIKARNEKIAYGAFCMSFVTQLKHQLNFESKEIENNISDTADSISNNTSKVFLMSIDMPKKYIIPTGDTVTKKKKPNWGKDEEPPILEEG